MVGLGSDGYIDPSMEDEFIAETWKHRIGRQELFFKDGIDRATSMPSIKRRSVESIGNFGRSLIGGGIAGRIGLKLIAKWVLLFLHGQGFFIAISSLDIGDTIANFSCLFILFLGNGSLHFILKLF